MSDRITKETNETKEAPRVAERAAEIIARASGMPRVQALTDDERKKWAREEAEREIEAEARHAERARGRAEASAPRGRGRPRWPRPLLERRYAEAKRATPEPKTTSRIAEHFVRLDGTIGIDPDSLRRLLRQHGIKVG